MGAIASAYRLLIVALAVVAGAAIALGCALIVVDVAIRAIGLRPPAFTSAVVEMVLLYFTLCAAPFLVREKGHVFIDVVLTRVTGNARWALEKFAYLVCVVTSLVFAYVGFGLLFEALRSGSFEERSIDVPSWIGFAPLGPIFLLVAVEFGRYLIGLDTMYVDRTKAADSL